jgi:transposase-like protein
VPPDQDGSFEPELVKKGQTRIDGMDDNIIGLYAAGLTVRAIRAHLEDVYGLEMSPDLISRVTDAVLSLLREWQYRALDRMYPIVIFDALRVKIATPTAAWSRTKPSTWPGAQLRVTLMHCRSLRRISDACQTVVVS